MNPRIVREMQVKIGGVLVVLTVTLYGNYRYIFRSSDKSLTKHPKWARIREKIWKMHNQIGGNTPSMAPYPDKKKTECS